MKLRNYETVKDVAGRIRSGELEIERLDRQGERGKIAGGQRNVEASIILGADAGAGQKAARGPELAAVQRRQEALLEQYTTKE